MYRSLKFVLPALLIAAALISFAAAQDDGALPGPKRYKFVLGPELKGDDAKNAVVKPAFKALADDQFNYEVYYNVRRSGGTNAGQMAGGFTRSETWTALCNLLMEEDEISGRKDLRAAFRYDLLMFDITDGDDSYSGYIGPGSGDGAARKSAQFWKIDKNGSRTNAYGIPGWAGISAGSVEGARSTQSIGANASAWFNIAGSGRIHSETYFAEFDSGDQRNYPGRLLDPMHIAQGLVPEFADNASVSLGANTVVRRRLPVGVLPGEGVEYDVTYTLEKVYGTLADPTCAQFKFSAKPVNAAHKTDLDAKWAVNFNAPEIADGVLVYDLIKGVAAVVRYKYSLKGELVAREGGATASSFACEAEFSASLGKETKK